MTNVREPDAELRSLEGECRVEVVPVNGQALLIDGLRLRLDLRLGSGSGTQAGKPRPPLLRRHFQQLAAMAALGALATALLVWLWGAPSAPVAALPPLQPAPAPLLAAPLPPPAALPVAEAPGVAMAPAAAPLVSKPVDTSAVVPRPPRSARVSPSASAAAAVHPPATASSAAPPRSAPNRDLIDLFADTK